MTPIQLDGVRLRRLEVIEETRERLHELRTRNQQMRALLNSVRIQLETARTQRPAAEPRPGSSPALKQPLSPRELQVLRQVAAGLPNKQIAVRLGISERTVRNHLSGVFARLHVRNRTEAVLKALRSGLLTV